ncbi:MAG: hypothetical protein R3B96_19425 [Pirellulaceae bacterium]
MVVHTNGNTVEQAMLLPARAVAVTLAEAGRRSGKESPGTRGKAVAMLRERLVAAREYLDKQAGDEESRPARDLELETWGKVLNRELAILVTCDRAQDIASALRLADEFKLDLWLDSAAEAYLLIDEIKQAGVPVIVHASMARAVGERENLTFENAAKLRDAGIPIAIQSGYEAYVPKTRVVLFEERSRPRTDSDSTARSRRSRSVPPASWDWTMRLVPLRLASGPIWPSTTATRLSTRRTASAR